MQTVLSHVDHLVYATAELGRGMAEIEQLLGVRPSVGGRHPLWGTCNAIVALGPRCYLEIIAPDPEHPPMGGERPFGLDAGGPSRLVGWAATGRELGLFRQRAAQLGVELGTLIGGSRERADGTLLAWDLTDPQRVLADGIVPFFIDWGDSPHPAKSAPQGATLVRLAAEHPQPARVQRMLQSLTIVLLVTPGPAARLSAQIDCPKGRVTLG